MLLPASPPALCLCCTAQGRLNEASSRFKPDVVEGGGGGGGNGSRIAFEIVEVVELEEEVEALDALLRAMYSATVAPATDVLVLLRALRLADRFLVSKPVAQQLASRLADVPIDAITDGVLALVFDERSDTLVAPLPLELMDKCRAYLRTAFRNVPDVVTQPALLRRFRALPHAAVVAWATSDKLQVHSENDVVYLLSRWVKAQETAGRPCSDEQLEQLVHAVRLADCGPTYLQIVVPGLDWFKSGLKHLSTFAIAQTFKDAGHTMPPDVPEAWTAQCREKLATCEAVVEFQLDTKELEVLDDLDEGVIYLGSVFINGFCMSASLQCRESKTTPGEHTLGCYPEVFGAKMAKVVPWPDHNAVACFFSIEVGEEEAVGPTDFVITEGSTWGLFDILGASAVSVAALVAPYLEGGQLKGKVTFADVDLMIRRA
jgi:hypothetical protein